VELSRPETLSTFGGFAAANPLREIAD